MNPNIATGMSREQEAESPEEAVARVIRYASLGARPRPIHPLIHTTPFGETKGLCTAQELRRRAWRTIIAGGAKAAIYRHYDWKSADENAGAVNDAIKTLNAEFRHIRRYLAIGDPVPWVENPKADEFLAASILAGDEALVIIIVPKTSNPTADAAQAEEPLDLTVSLPAGLEADSIFTVTPEGLAGENAAFLQKDEQTIVRIQKPKTDGAYLLTTKHHTARGQQ